MNVYVAFVVLVIAVIVAATVINKFFPPDYHQRVEEKYNQNNE